MRDSSRFLAKLLYAVSIASNMRDKTPRVRRETECTSGKTARIVCDTERKTAGTQSVAAKTQSVTAKTHCVTGKTQGVTGGTESIPAGSSEPEKCPLSVP